MLDSLQIYCREIHMAAVRPHDAESVRLEQLEKYLGNFDTGKRCNCGGNIIDNASLGPWWIRYSHVLL
jgi:hypothetical protein